MNKESLAAKIVGKWCEWDEAAIAAAGKAGKAEVYFDVMQKLVAEAIGEAAGPQEVSLMSVPANHHAVIGAQVRSHHEAIAVLNEMHALDPTVLPAMIENRVPCNAELADHPTAQVCALSEFPDNGSSKSFEIGLLGVLNAIFGINSKGSGYISAVYADKAQDGDKLLRFEAVPVQN